jgi:hypothetical protein
MHLFYCFSIHNILLGLLRFPLGSLGFFTDVILPAALWAGVDSACNRNEYQGYFLGVEAAGV